MHLTNCSPRTYLQSFGCCSYSLWTAVSTLLLCMKFLPPRYFLGPKKYKLPILSPECEECTKTYAQRIKCFEVLGLLMCLLSLYCNAQKLPIMVSFQHIISLQLIRCSESSCVWCFWGRSKFPIQLSYAPSPKQEPIMQNAKARVETSMSFYVIL